MNDECSINLSSRSRVHTALLDLLYTSYTAYESLQFVSFIFLNNQKIHVHDQL